MAEIRDLGITTPLPMPEHPQTRIITITAERMDRVDTREAIHAVPGIRAVDTLAAVPPAVADTRENVHRARDLAQPLTNHDAVIHDGRWLRLLNPFA